MKSGSDVVKIYDLYGADVKADGGEIVNEGATLAAIEAALRGGYYINGTAVNARWGRSRAPEYTVEREEQDGGFIVERGWRNSSDER